MFPYDKSQSEMNSRRASSDLKLQPKNKQSPRNERDNVENTDADYQRHEEVIHSKQDIEHDEKPQVFNIKYVVPSNLIIRELQTPNTNELPENFQESAKG